MEEKKSTYTDAQKKAIKKYLHDSVDDLRIRVPKGQKDIIKSYAEAHGESLNGFVVRAVNEAMERDE